MTKRTSSAGRKGSSRKAGAAPAVKKVIDSERMRELGRLGGLATVELHGVGHLSDAGRRGGKEVRKRYGKEHFAELGRRGGARLRELAAEGRASEARAAKKTA